MHCGYRPDLEDPSILYGAADNSGLDWLLKASIPSQVTHRDWLMPRHQGDDPTGSHVNSCVGHGAWAAVRILNHNDGGIDVNPSPLWLYLAAQYCSGYFGADQGASITGARKALEQMGGGVLERDYPYSLPYPSAFDAIETPNKVLQHANPRTPDDVRQYIGSRKGTCLIGVPMTTAMRDSAYWTMREVTGGDLIGMHCMSVNGYWPNSDFDGLNSWGTRIHENGFWRCTPDVVQYWINLRGSEVVLFSDIVEWRVREYVAGMLVGR